jgi:trimeric autotransporter adhesin
MAVSTERTDALNLSMDLAQAGAVFNDATRLLDGGLWSQPNANNQTPYLGMFTADTTAVLNDIKADLANPAMVTVGGTAYTLSDADTAVLNSVETQLQTLLTDAPNSVGDATAQNAIHATQLAIITEVNGDPSLAAALAAATYTGASTGLPNTGFQTLPVGADDGAALAAAVAHGATLADIGTVFNAANDLAVGGLNDTNLPEFNRDMHVVATGLANLLHNTTELAAIESGEAPADAALTTIHLQTMLNQIDLQINKFDPLYQSDPNVAARSTNDNLLDIIDIVQGDANLNMAAGGDATGNVGGFSNMPAYLHGTIQHYQDDQAQTNFWATFIAEANTINNDLTAVAGGGTPSTGSVASLITEIQNYEKYVVGFDNSQGGIFGARFDNELLLGTVNADTKAAIAGLTGIMNGDTGAALAADQAEIGAAGQGFVANATDVSGNNTPIGGGSYVADATTVAGATSTPGVAMGTIPVGPTPGPGDHGGPGGHGGRGGPGDHGGPGVASHDPAPIMATPTFEHMWHHA